MIVALMTVLFSLTAFAGEGITDATQKRYDAAIEMFDELYLKKNPEGALAVYECSYNDRQTLKKASQKITKGASTDKEKAKKIYDWVDKNISYNHIYSSLAIDTYNSKKSQCYGFANLTRDLLKSAGIPAVTVTGWRGNMAGEWVQSEKELYTQEAVTGHAWTMAYINGKWELLDCLFDDYMPSEEYIIQWCYIEKVENLVPYYTGIYIHTDEMFYKSGKIVHLDKNGNKCDGFVDVFANNISVCWPYDAYKYRKTGTEKKLTEEKISGKAGTYARYLFFHSEIPIAPIKTKPDGTIQNYNVFTYKGNTVYTAPSGSSVFLDASVKEVNFAAGGALEIMKGEKIKMYPMLESDKKKHGITYKYYSNDTSIVTVDKNGYIKGKAYGDAEVWVKMFDRDDTCIYTESIPVFCQ